MSIARINGPMLQPNLERQGINIALDANLTYWDVNNRYVGINNTTPEYPLDVTGNVHLSNIIIQGNTISTDSGGKLNLGNIANITISGGIGVTNGVIFTDGFGNLRFGNIDAAIGTLTNFAATGNITSGNVLAGGFFGSFYGNVVADTITPYETQVVTFTNTTAIGLPAGSDSQYPTSNVAGYFRYNTVTNSPEFYNGSDWVAILNQITDQQIAGDGSSISFTLNQASPANGLIVSINGTLQRPGVAYSVSGTTITFAEIPQVTDIIDIRFISSGAVANSPDVFIVDTANVSVGTSNVIIDSFSVAEYRSAKYIISSLNGTDGTFAEVSVMQNNGVVLLNAYGIMNTGGNTLIFNSNISGTFVNVLAQGTTGSNQLRIQKTYFDL
jgi:hypothetical protein